MKSYKQFINETHLVMENNTYKPKVGDWISIDDWKKNGYNYMVLRDGIDKWADFPGSQFAIVSPKYDFDNTPWEKIPSYVPKYAINIVKVGTPVINNDSVDKTKPSYKSKIVIQTVNHASEKEQNTVLRGWIYHGSI